MEVEVEVEVEEGELEVVCLVLFLVNCPQDKMTDIVSTFLSQNKTFCRDLDIVM